MSRLILELVDQHLPRGGQSQSISTGRLGLVGTAGGLLRLVIDAGNDCV